MRAYVGVTDGEWYRFLAARPYLSEVNFWRPSGTADFRALNIGEPFLFKTHYPENRGGAPARQRTAAPIRRTHTLRQRISGS